MVRVFLCLMFAIDSLLEWKEIKFPPAIRRIVSRVSNRVFVGPSLCKTRIPIISMSVYQLIFHRSEPRLAGP